MNKLYLSSVKIEETVEAVEENPVAETSTTDAFFNDYDNQNVITNIDEFNNYNLGYDSIVTYKEARTAVEEKRPFIIDKIGQNKEIENTDKIYKTLSKMKIANKMVERVGFIQVYNKPKQIKIKERNKKKYRGIANEAFLITKKKSFNQKKIGYLPLQESTVDKDLYVEITTSRGYQWLLILIMLLGILGFIFATKDWDGWNFNLDRLTLYKTQETVEYKESALSIGFNATTVVENGNVNILLTSEFAEGLTYKAMIYDENNNLLFESDEIQAGDGLNNISLNDNYSADSNYCTLACETFRNGNYIGTVESELVFKNRSE